ncbi:MAG: hypothetical protein HY329_13465 [Chloroflexi bacterium]|nr:hypothetical protein [Chloroflexota bacterium]
MGVIHAGDTTLRPNLNNIAPGLIERDQWVCWRLQPSKRDPSILAKIPKNARTGRNASTTDPTTWNSFDVAAAAYRESPTSYDGIGFVFSNDDDFAGLDLDGCRNPETGEIAAWAWPIIKQLNTRTEISPSGTGVKMFARGSLPPGRRSGEIEAGDVPAKVELYSDGRFFTVTGLCVPGTPETIEERAAKLHELHAEIFGRPEPVAPMPAPTPVALNGHPQTGHSQNGTSSMSTKLRYVTGPGDLTDDELLEKARSAMNGAHFTALFNHGDVSGYQTKDRPTGDHSRADMALVGHLAFYTGRDTNRIDRLFRRSRLYRDKWDERRGTTTYGGQTIDKVLSGRTEFWSPDYRSQSDHEDEAKTRVEEIVSASAVEKVFDNIDVLAGLNLIDFAKAKAQLKQSFGKQLNLNDLERAVAEARRQTARPSSTGLPNIVAHNRQLPEITAEAIAMLERANDPPYLFVRGGMLTRVRRDEQGRPGVESLSEPQLRRRLARVAHYVALTKNGEQQIPPPNEVVRDILSLDRWPFPALTNVTEAPVLRADGTILDQPGYDASASLVYAPPLGLTVAAIPEKPKADDVKAALELLDEAIGDFPYTDAPSKANLLGLMLTPVLREAIAGQVPLALIDKPKAGTGASLLADVVTMITTGRNAAVMTMPNSDEEVRKKLTSVLLEGSTIVLLDNIEGTLKSPNLAACLTSPIWKDRALGGNTMLTLP